MALHIALEGSLSNRRGKREIGALAKGGGGCELKGFPQSGVRNDVPRPTSGDGRAARARRLLVQLRRSDDDADGLAGAYAHGDLRALTRNRGAILRADDGDLRAFIVSYEHGRTDV